MLRSNENYAELKPMYPLLIQQFVDDYDLMHGIAFDIGAGPGLARHGTSKNYKYENCFLTLVKVL